MRRFLERFHIRNPRLSAIDLADMATIFAASGAPLENVDFAVADACNLNALPSASFDLLVQDSLLNCSPHALHARIFMEAARLLRIDGVAIVNFTDQTGVSSLSARREVMDGGNAYCLADIAASPDELGRLRESLCGSVIVNTRHDHFTFVTPPYGNFEFYFPEDRVLRLLAKNGLNVVNRHLWQGRDQYGHLCRRHQIVAVRTGAT